MLIERLVALIPPHLLGSSTTQSLYKMHLMVETASYGGMNTPDRESGDLDSNLNFV